MGYSTGSRSRVLAPSSQLILLVFLAAAEWVFYPYLKSFQPLVGVILGCTIVQTKIKSTHVSFILILLLIEESLWMRPSIGIGLYPAGWLFIAFLTKWIIGKTVIHQPKRVVDMATTMVFALLIGLFLDWYFFLNNFSGTMSWVAQGVVVLVVLWQQQTKTRRRKTRK